MESIIHADIFFFITTIAVIVGTVVIAWGGFYLIQSFRNFRDISRTLKRGVDNAEENIEDLYHDIEESSIFRFIFGARHYRRTSLKADKKRVLEK
jgi:hypothetical protein